MAYDLEEQEQLASLKAFWSQYGNLVTWVLIAGLGSYAAYNYWNFHQRSQASEASGLYETLQQSVQAKDNAKVQRIAGDIESKFGGSSYAPMSALVAAKSAFDANDNKLAKTQLQWAAEHGNDEIKAVARLRLAAVQLDDKAYDEAIKTLGGEFPTQFAAEVADRKGDVLVAQNKLAEARGAYQAALAAMEAKAPGRQLVQLKLDAIGGAVATPAAAPAKA